jgi:hypothetical protein
MARTATIPGASPGTPHLSSQFTAHAFGMRQWHPNPGGDESCLRYRQNVITGVVMVIVGVLVGRARDTLLPERSASVEPESALAQNR